MVAPRGYLLRPQMYQTCFMPARLLVGGPNALSPCLGGLLLLRHCSRDRMERSQFRPSSQPGLLVDTGRRAALVPEVRVRVLEFVSPRGGWSRGECRSVQLCRSHHHDHHHRYYVDPRAVLFGCIHSR